MYSRQQNKVCGLFHFRDCYLLVFLFALFIVLVRMHMSGVSKVDSHVDEVASVVVAQESLENVEIVVYDANNDENNVDDVTKSKMFLSMLNLQSTEPCFVQATTASTRRWSGAARAAAVRNAIAWLDDDEKNVITDRIRLAHLARMTGNLDNAVEVGVQFGLLSQQLLRAYGGRNYWLVDIVKTDLIQRMFTRWQQAYKSSVGYRCTSIRLVQATSMSACGQFPDNFFNFIYIDAMHTYEAVLQDMECYWRKLAPYGLFAGHDYCISRQDRDDNPTAYSRLPLCGSYHEDGSGPKQGLKPSQFGVIQAVASFVSNHTIGRVYYTAEHALADHRDDAGHKGSKSPSWFFFKVG